MPWDTKPATPQVYATVGAVACYRFKMNEDEDSEWEFKHFWSKGYAVQTGSLHWSPSEDVLYIGFDDGSINRLKITENGLNTEV